MSERAQQDDQAIAGPRAGVEARSRQPSGDTLARSPPAATTRSRSGTSAGIEPLEHARGERSVHVLVAGEKDYYKKIVEALASADIALIDHVLSEDKLFEKLQSEEFDCIIADQTACGRNSLELREIIEKRIPNHPAMIMFANVNNEKVIIKAFRSGFSDFVSSDFGFARDLLQAVRRSVERNRRTQILLDELEHLSKLALYDRTTGVANRVFLEERLASLINSAGRHRHQFAVLLVDLNNFSAICDTYGQAIGDRALRAFAQKLMQASRASDSFGRFGQSEFLYLVDREVSFASVEQTCARLAQELSFFVELDTVGMALSASIGGALFPSDGKSSGDLLSAARLAMETARAAHRGHHLAQPTQEATTSAEAAALQIVSGTEEAAIATPDSAGVAERTANRRRERRDRVLFRGRIVLSDGFSTIDCVVRDLSQHGARVTVQDHAVVPRTLSLAIVDTGRFFEAIRRWQNGHDIGLEFSVEGTKSDDKKS